MDFFKAKGITKRFGGIFALNNVDFSITKGEIVGLIGPNGAGKTTFFNVLSGVLPLTSGDFYFKREKITGLKPYKITKLGISRTFQNIQLFSSMNVFESVLVGRHCRTSAGIISALVGGKLVEFENKRSREVVEELLAFVGLSDKIITLAESLPYGEQRHLEVARALATEPELLLLDEPSAGMNTKETESLMELIVDLKKKRNVTVLLIEHDMNLVMGICDRIVVLDHGKLIATGTPKKIRNHKRVIEAYLGREGDYADMG